MKTFLEVCDLLETLKEKNKKIYFIYDDILYEKQNLFILSGALDYDKQNGLIIAYSKESIINNYSQGSFSSRKKTYYPYGSRILKIYLEDFIKINRKGIEYKHKIYNELAWDSDFNYEEYEDKILIHLD